MDEIEYIDGSDYINASFIKLPNNDYEYIAAQGPTALTIFDFLRMLLKYNVNTLICACNEYEGDKVTKLLIQLKKTKRFKN